MPTTSFAYTGAFQTFVVPGHVSSIVVECSGAQGGQRVSGTAKGGYIKATVPVTPGETLRVYVGGQGGTAHSANTWAAGFNGGGEGGVPSVDGWGGGGATDVRRTPFALGDRLVVAGGGGGDSSYDSGGATTAAGGAGARPTGGDGGYYPVFGAAFRGQGGTSSAGGAKGVDGTSGTHVSTDGASGVGGQGWGDGGQLGRGGGGGGGGGFGGGGGAETGGGGGGSSAVLGASVLITDTTGAQVGDGSATIQYVGVAGNPYGVTQVRT